ncbi:MAG: invasion associated locus B family protein [Rhodospirillales bacterium]
MARNIPTLATAITLASLALASPAGAQSVDPLGKSGDWESFSYQENGKSVCFMASAPQKATGDYTKRGDTYIMVTHRPAEKAMGVVSFEAGYAFKGGSEAQVSVGSANWKLFVSGSNAFAYDDKADRALVAAMKAGSTLVVKGTSSRGTLTTDTYSLSGFTKAYNTISAKCR